MTLLFNFKANRLENVAEEQVTDLLASGEYGARKGTSVPVQAPDGRIGVVPSETAQQAMLQGFKFHTTADANAKMQSELERQKQERLAGTTGLAFGAGVARGATFGLSDVAVRGIAGEEGAAELQAIREASPIASGVGEAAGAIGGGLLAGPVAGVTKLGSMTVAKTAATATVSKLAAKGAAGEIAAEILAKGAGSAVEGAFYGAGELVTEAALGDPNLTAANAATIFGGNILLGGAVGGLVPGAATAAQKAKENIRKILVDDMNVPAKAMDAFGKLVSFAKLATPEQKAAFKEFAAPTTEARALREVAFDLYENPQKASQAAIEAVSQLKDLGKFEASVLGDVRESLTQPLKVAKIAEQERENFVSDIAYKLSGTIAEAADRPNKYVGGAGQDLTTVLNELTSQASKAENLADMHKSIHNARSVFDGFFKEIMEKRKIGTYEERNTAKLVLEARREMNDLLHSEKMFPGAGNAYKQADDAFSEYMTVAKEFRKGFEGKVFTRGGEDYKIKRGKATGLIRSPASDLAEEKQEIFDAMTQAIESLNAASRGASPAVETALKEINGNLNKIKAARAAGILLSNMEAKTGRALLAPVVGMALGETAQETGMTDMPGAGVAGFLGGALLANPKTVMMYLMRLERGNVAAAGAIEEASRKYLGSKIPASVSGNLDKIWRGRGTTINTLVKELGDTPDDLPDSSDDMEAFKRQLSPFGSIEHTANTARDAHPLLEDIAPNTFAALTNKQQQAIEFIRSKLPASRDSLFAGKVALAQSEKIHIDRYVQASLYPSELLHEMSEGNVRPETVEAVRMVYPEMFSQIQRSITETLADPDVQRKLSRRRKLELAKVLGIPTSESLQHVDLLQQSWVAEQPEPTPGKMQTGNAMAPSEAIQSRMA